ncbi:WD40 repeat domain-containing protein [Nonomuraea lactucae]|uniref:WD40 repeat domain-containing protein n=1 Tax=Nonomuraea lactucae TaxID=2249762 RepID=UPI000DE21E4B|nr:hypothetical protein [Nonomuraea lactucae]
MIVWDVADPAAPRPLGRPFTAYSGWVFSLAFRPKDGHTLVTGGWNGAVILWDVTDPAHAREISRAPTGHINAVDDDDWQPNTVEAVAFSPDGRTMATAGEDKNLSGLRRIQRRVDGCAIALQPWLAPLDLVTDALIPYPRPAAAPASMPRNRGAPPKPISSR